MSDPPRISEQISKLVILVEQSIDIQTSIINKINQTLDLLQNVVNTEKAQGCLTKEEFEKYFLRRKTNISLEPPTSTRSSSIEKTWMKYQD